MAEHKRKYREAHPVDPNVKKAQFKAWQRKNRDYNLSRRREWLSKNRERYNEYRRIRLATNPEVQRAQKNRRLKAMFGISLSDYEAMLERQGGLCAICKKPPTTGPVKILVVDHDHKTGKVRELLCSICNTAIGAFGEEKGVLANAIAYLEKHGR